MGKTTKASSIFKAIEEWAPLRLAYDWDNVGLQIGSYTKEVKKVMVTLDVLESVVDEAIEKKANLIIAHHPLLFRPIRQINVNDVKGKIINKLIKHDITVYAAHTNLDIATDGVNDMLCQKLGIHQVRPLTDIKSDSLFKIAVFVPVTHSEEVRHALSEGGAGHIGNYSHCTFQTMGQGTFKPLEGTNPYIGTKDQIEFVDEVKIESIVKREDLKNTIHLMAKAHPYEEVAYDIFPLENDNTLMGLGRIGKLEQPMTLKSFSHYVKEKLELSNVRVIGDLNDHIQKVAVLGGSGEKYIRTAKSAGADAYITGDMTFHVAQDAMEMGLNVIDAGHYIEKVMKEEVKQALEYQFNDIEVIISKTNTDPFTFI